MDEKAVDFFQQHSIQFLEMALQTGKLERLTNPDGYGKYSRECGDEVEIFLIARNGSIESASFYTEGCIFTSACANTLVHLIEGKPIPDARRVMPRQLIEYLETLPEKEHHCAELVVSAFRAALKDLDRTKMHPEAGASGQ